MIDAPASAFKCNGLWGSIFLSTVALSANINLNPVVLQQIIQQFNLVCQRFDGLKNRTQIGHKSNTNLLPKGHSVWSGPFLFSNQANTLLHEVLHAVSHQMGKFNLTSEQEEKMVEGMATGLCVVMRDNPKLFPLIQKALK